MSVDFEKIQAAAERIKRFSVVTPLRRWDYLKRTLKFEAPIFLKLETLQNTGAFKVRGASNKILSLKESGKVPSAVVAASAGNHAQAVAFVAGQLGIQSMIVMPEGAPLVKAAATRDYGAQVFLHGTVYDDAFARAQELLKATPGAVYVHAYEDAEIIAGQGTLGLEIDQQLSEAGIRDSHVQVVVPIGGGGLISGVAIALKKLRPQVKLFGVVTEAAPAMAESFEKGQLVDTSGRKGKRTLGEGLAVKKVSAMTFEIIKEHVTEVAIVTDDEMAQAIAALMERGKLVVEGSGAAGVAAALSKKFKQLDPKVPTVFVLCGGNIDMNLLSNILERGLTKDGRWLTVRLTVEDRPGQLAKVASRIGELRANILEVIHDRTSPACPVGHTRILFKIETQDKAHATEVRQGLESLGHALEVVNA
jgi:threonine dehydratase